MPQSDAKKSSVKGQQENDHVAPYPKYLEAETFDLYKILISLWNKKWLIISVTVVAAIGSIVYALLQTPFTYYKVQALLVPTTKKSVFKINYDKDGETQLPRDIILYELTRDFVLENHRMGGMLDHALEKFKRNLTSRNNQNIFFEKEGLTEYLAKETTPEASDANFRQILSNLSVSDVGGNNDDQKIAISTEFTIPINFTKWLNSYIEFVETKTISELLEQIRYSIQEEIKYTKKKIISNQEEQKKFFRNRILLYEEAAQIALALGIEERVNSDFSSSIDLGYGIVDPPLYYRGYKALNIEIEFLKKRSWDGPNKKEIFELEKKLTRLSSIEILEEDFHIMNFEKPAYQTKTVKTISKVRTIALSIMFGFLSGIFLVLFIEFFQNQKKNHSK